MGATMVDTGFIRNAAVYSCMVMVARTRTESCASGGHASPAVAPLVAVNDCDVFLCGCRICGERDIYRGNGGKNPQSTPM